MKRRDYRKAVAELSPAQLRVLGRKLGVEQESEGKDRLVGYVLADDRGIELDNLRRHVSRTLPDYMVPAEFVVIDSLPRTANGKVDRDRLPDLNQPPATILQSDTLDRPVANVIAGIWQDLLGARVQSPSDNFFELGGHSLVALLLMQKVEEALGVKLPISSLFEAPTLGEFARLIDRREKVDNKNIVTLQPLGSRRPLFLFHGLGGSVMLYSELARLLAPETPVYGLTAFGLVEGFKPHDRIEQMASEYIKEIRTVQPSGPYALAGRCFGGVIAYEVAQQLRSAGEAVAYLGIIEGELRSERGLFAPTWLGRIGFGKLGRFADPRRVLRLALANLRSVAKLRSSTRAIQYDRVREACEAARRAYQPKPYDGFIDLYGTRPWKDERISTGNRGLWRRLAKGGLNFQQIAGMQGTMLDLPRVRRLAELIERRLIETSLNT